MEKLRNTFNINEFNDHTKAQGRYDEPFGLDVGVERHMELPSASYTSGTQPYFTEKSNGPPTNDFGDTTEDA